MYDAPFLVLQLMYNFLGLGLAIHHRDEVKAMNGSGGVWIMLQNEIVVVRNSASPVEPYDGHIPIIHFVLEPLRLIVVPDQPHLKIPKRRSVIWVCLMGARGSTLFNHFSRSAASLSALVGWSILANTFARSRSMVFGLQQQTKNLQDRETEPQSYCNK